jgi:thioredoxin-dependent peroxiredoxin
MKTTLHPRLVLVLPLIVASFLVMPAKAENPADFTVKSALDDSSFRLSDHQGKVVVLHFLLKTECPVCLRYTHDYAALAASNPGVVHLFLKPDSDAEIRTWADKIDRTDLANVPAIYRDGMAKLAKDYGIPDGYAFHGQVVHFPALVALDGEGKELFRYVGKNNSDRLSPADFTAKLAAAGVKQ